MSYSLEIYRKQNRSCPYNSWFNKLKDKQAKALILLRLDRIKKGNVGDVKSVGNAIHELRIHHGPGYRIYYTKIGTTIILLLCAGAKLTQKQDIVQAKEFLSDYKEQQS